MSYQSPINLSDKNVIYIDTPLEVKGKNKGSIYNEETKMFTVENRIE